MYMRYGLWGGGANTIYLANEFENIQFIGMDINKEFIDYGNAELKRHSKFMNCRLYEEDWLHINSEWRGKFDGIISFQTLFMFPEYKEPLKQLASLQPDWIALSSLFYEGDIEYTNKFRDYYRPSNNKEYTDYYYNIHSMPRFKEYMKELGYEKFEYIPFNIDIDLPKPNHMDLATYTVRTEDGKRLQISAGMMMPWYFIIASK